MISIVDASELEHVLRPTVYRPSPVGDQEQRRPSSTGPSRRLSAR